VSVSCRVSSQWYYKQKQTKWNVSLSAVSAIKRLHGRMCTAIKIVVLWVITFCIFVHRYESLAKIFYVYLYSKKLADCTASFLRKSKSQFSIREK
jgi:hypothetical protein